jgi:ATP-binding protein involved in chromosome partitioning
LINLRNSINLAPTHLSFTDFCNAVVSVITQTSKYTSTNEYRSLRIQQSCDMFVLFQRYQQEIFMPLPIFAADTSTKEKSSIHTILAVAAGKGGVGKSTVTVNLALALREKGYSVGILDSDIYGPSIRKMLPERLLPTQKGDWLIPADCFGMPVMSMAYFRPQQQATAVRAPIANSVIAQFLNNVAWGQLDYLIIDFPPGTGDIQLTLSQKAKITAAIMVTTPQEVSLIDVRRAIALFDQVQVPILGIVENMSYFQPTPQSAKLYPLGKGGGSKLAIEYGQQLLAEIPLDPIVSERSDKGFSIFVDDGNGLSPAVTAFHSLADHICNHFSCNKDSTAQSSSLDLTWKEMDAHASH